MRRSRSTYCLLLVACLLAETSGGNISAVLGGSATFQVKTEKEFTLISWTRAPGSKEIESLAYLTPKTPCEATVLIPAFSTRMNVSADCKQLHIHELRRTDSGLFTAQIQLQEEQQGPLRQAFQLGVFKRLSEADLLVRCEGRENSTWLLSCSVQEGEEGVEISWAPTSSSEVLDPGNRLLIWRDPQDLEQNVTCTARNPAGPASKTASLAQLCTAQAERTTARPVTDSAWENGGGNGRATWVVVVGLIIAAGLLLIIVLAVWKKRGFCRKQTAFASSSEPIDSTPLSVQVENIPANSLQTDDEKMQKERWRAQKESDKTVYSEVQLQEKEDQNIKTVYETLNHPKPGGAL